MQKVVKFGGSSLANATQFKKVKNIVESDAARNVVVVSALGKRNKEDHKITDLLYLTAAHLKYSVDAMSVFNIIKERYQDKLSISSVAEELNVSPSFLSRRIKANMNVTFVDMLNQYRVNRALHLLNEGTMRIYEVSDILGFSEYKYFCSVFKKYTGVTPSEFVKNGGMIKVRDK